MTDRSQNSAAMGKRWREQLRDEPVPGPDQLLGAASISGSTAHEAAIQAADERGIDECEALWHLTFDDGMPALTSDDRYRIGAWLRWFHSRGGTLPEALAQLLFHICDPRGARSPFHGRHRDRWERAIAMEAAALPDPAGKNPSAVSLHALASAIFGNIFEDGEALDGRDDRKTLRAWRQSAAYRAAVERQRLARYSADRSEYQSDLASVVRAAAEGRAGQPYGRADNQAEGTAPLSGWLDRSLWAEREPPEEADAPPAEQQSSGTRPE